MSSTSLKNYWIILLTAVFSLPWSSAEARHIIGGVVNYECLGGGTFRITMRIFRDCEGGGAGFDGTAPFGVYRGDNTEALETIRVRIQPNITDVPIDDSDPCLVIPPGVCVEEGIYQFEYTIPDYPSTESYHFTYQRCCRNNTIVNIQRPGDVGATFTTEITAAAQAGCNNSPVFDFFPPPLICVDQLFDFDHSATDADGDQIVYEFCAPLLGGGRAGINAGDPDGCDGVTPDPGCPPPYAPVNFVSPPYNTQNPLGGNPQLSIDPFTGQITGVPNLLGQFLIGVCMYEFRDGVLLSTVRREFQVNVANCEPLVDAVIAADTADLANDRYVLQNCDSTNITFENLSPTSNAVDDLRWVFTLPDGDTSITEFEPSIQFPEEGEYDALLLINEAGGCADTAFIKIRIFKGPTIDFASDYDTCVAGPIKFENLTVNGSAPIDSIFWNFGDGSNSDRNSPLYEYEEPGVYPVDLFAADENGCFQRLRQFVPYQPVPNLIIVSPDDRVSCPPATIGFENLSAIVDDTYSVLWDFGDGNQSTAQAPTNVYQESGIYDVSISILSPIGCETDTVFSNLIEIQEEEIANFDWTNKELTQINNNTEFIDLSVNAVSWEWYINDNRLTTAQNPSYSFPDTGWQAVTLIVTHPQQCQDTITQLVDVAPEVRWFMPNAFTPDEDSENEFFRGNGIMLGIRDFEMRIWDRNGSTIFTSNDWTIGWNGRIQNDGRQAPEGTYFYQVRYIKPRETEVTEGIGELTLIR